MHLGPDFPPIQCSERIIEGATENRLLGDFLV